MTNDSGLILDKANIFSLSQMELKSTSIKMGLILQNSPKTFLASSVTGNGKKQAKKIKTYFILCQISSKANKIHCILPLQGNFLVIFNIHTESEAEGIQII